MLRPAPAAFLRRARSPVRCFRLARLQREAVYPRCFPRDRHSLCLGEDRGVDGGAADAALRGRGSGASRCLLSHALPLRGDLSGVPADRVPATASRFLGGVPSPHWDRAGHVCLPVLRSDSCSACLGPGGGMEEQIPRPEPAGRGPRMARRQCLSCLPLLLQPHRCDLRTVRRRGGLVVPGQPPLRLGLPVPGPDRGLSARGDAANLSVQRQSAPSCSWRRGSA